jgi:hypothetical protein
MGILNGYRLGVNLASKVMLCAQMGISPNVAENQWRIAMIAPDFVVPLQQGNELVFNEVAKTKKSC